MVLQNVFTGGCVLRAYLEGGVQRSKKLEMNGNIFLVFASYTMETKKSAILNFFQRFPVFSCFFGKEDYAMKESPRWGGRSRT